MEATERESRLAADVRTLANLLGEADQPDLADRLRRDADRIERGDRYRLDVLWTDLGHDQWRTEDVRLFVERIRAEAEAINRASYGAR